MKSGPATRSIASIIGPPGVGKTTLVRRLGIVVDDDRAWQNAVGVSARDGWSDDQLRAHIETLPLPSAVIVCVGPAALIRARNAKRHDRRPGKPDWSPHVERALETTALVRGVLAGQGVPVLDVDMTRVNDRVILGFVGRGCLQS